MEIQSFIFIDVLLTGKSFMALSSFHKIFYQNVGNKGRKDF